MVPIRLASSHRYSLPPYFFVTWKMMCSVCLKFTNAVYVTNGDKSSPSSIYIYDATAKSWSTQAVTTGTFNPASFNAILDHDTNVFCAFLPTPICTV